MVDVGSGRTRAVGVFAAAVTVAGLGIAGSASAAAETRIDTAVAAGVVNRPVAAAKKKAKFVVKRTLKKAKNKSGVSYDLRVAQLRGGTAKQRKAVNRAIRAEVAAAKRSYREWRKCVIPSDPNSGYGYFTIRTVSAAVYRGRYASVLLDVSSNPGCGGVGDSQPYGVTIDLKSGKRVSLSRFAATSGVLKPALEGTIYAALKGANKCVWEENRDKLVTGITSWAVSKRGLTVAYGRYAIAEGACGTVSHTVPWKYVVRPQEYRGKSRTTVYTTGVTKYPQEDGSVFYQGTFKIITQRGKVVYAESVNLGMDGSSSLGKVGSNSSINAGEGSYWFAKPGWQVKKGRAVAPAPFRKATKAELKILGPIQRDVFASKWF